MNGSGVGLDMDYDGELFGLLRTVNLDGLDGGANRLQIRQRKMEGESKHVVGEELGSDGSHQITRLNYNFNIKSCNSVVICDNYIPSEKVTLLHFDKNVTIDCYISLEPVSEM